VGEGEGETGEQNRGGSFRLLESEWARQGSGSTSRARVRPGGGAGKESREGEERRRGWGPPVGDLREVRGARPASRFRP
jgi:hypothetical protein